MNNLTDLRNEIIKEAHREKARRSFWHYCKLTHPDFFKDERQHLVTLSKTLQSLYEGKLINEKTGKPYRKLMINMPPRHGKSFSLTKFCEWALGKNNTNRVITISYNETLSGRFSKAVRNNIEQTNIDESKTTFQDVFKTKIKHGDASAQLWSLEGQFFNYLGSSFTGTVTGVGCNIGIIDDPIKNAEEAFNDRVLQSHYDFYVNTFLQRLESGSIQIINMTRWATKDLCGVLLEQEPEDWYVLKMEVCDEAGNMLCSDLLSLEDYNDKKKKMATEILRANYHQQPMDVQGRLYKSFKVYNELPKDEQGKTLLLPIHAYIDTADSGDDYLCCVVFAIHNSCMYVLDVYYSKEGMEITEPAIADVLIKNGVQYCKIESNNGGKGFTRAVQSILDRKGHPNIILDWYHQTANKEARILTNKHWIEQNCYFPYNWEHNHADFYTALKTYTAQGKNKHDDAPDALTGAAEMVNVSKIEFY